MGGSLDQAVTDDFAIQGRFLKWKALDARSELPNVAISNAAAIAAVLESGQVCDAPRALAEMRRLLRPRLENEQNMRKTIRPNTGLTQTK